MSFYQQNRKKKNNRGSSIYIWINMVKETWYSRDAELKILRDTQTEDEDQFLSFVKPPGYNFAISQDGCFNAET